MTTLGQVLANRENAQLSTGPKTEEGKAASARNAIKHGMEAKLLLPDEDAAEFHQFRQAFSEEMDPQSRQERQLVDEVVMLYWKQARLERLEQEFWTRGMQPGPDGRVSSTPLADMLCAHGKEFASLLRYTSQMSRALDRTKKELRELQEQRKLQTMKAAAAAARQANGAGAMGGAGSARAAGAALPEVGVEADGAIAVLEAAGARVDALPAQRAAAGGNANGNGNGGGAGQKPRPPAARNSQFIPSSRR